MAVGDRNDPYAQFNFVVEIDGVEVAGFTEVGGLAAESDVIEYREGNEQATVRKLPGLRKYSNVTLKRGYTQSTALWDWRKTSEDGQTERLDGAIVLMDEARSPVLRWPNPTLEGGIDLERVVVPGTLQFRMGLGLEGFLLGAQTDPPLLAPSLVPVPVMSLAFMPKAPSFARLSVSGGYLWYTDGGTWHNGWTARASLVIGVGF